MKSEIINRARNRAIEERGRLNVGAYEPIDILKILREKENISIIITELKGKISGFFIKKQNNGLVIINSDRSLGHQLFTAAHEYYHIKYDDGMNGKVCSIGSYENDSDIEIEANYFASYFLMPDDSLRYHLNKRVGSNEIKLSDLIFLENYFMVSHALMLRRLKDINMIDETFCQEYRANIIANAKKLGYSTKLYEKPSLENPLIISEYAELANELLEKGKITNGKYEELLAEGGYFELLINGNEEEDDRDEDSFDF